MVTGHGSPLAVLTKGFLNDPPPRGLQSPKGLVAGGKKLLADTPPQMDMLQNPLRNDPGTDSCRARVRKLEESCVCGNAFVSAWVWGSRLLA